jgi:hypothetical protein
MKDPEIDQALDQAAGVPHAVPDDLLERIGASIEPTLSPVQPLPPTWMLTAGLMLIGAAVALLGAARVGLLGFEALSPPSRLAIFGTLAILACAAAMLVVSECIPGARRFLTPGALLAVVCAAQLALFALLFEDYRTTHFVSAGLTCLSTGLLHAAVGALLGWWWLRRGWVANPVSAGLAAGVLAGLAGVAMLELHCNNFQALHVLVWHTAVVPVSGALGATLAWTLRRFRAQVD